MGFFPAIGLKFCLSPFSFLHGFNVLSSADIIRIFKKRSGISANLSKFAAAMQQGTTICAIATPQGVGGIAVIRVSGQDTMNVVEKVFSKSLQKAKSHTAHLGLIKEEGVVVDEVVATLFCAPNSFTGEDVVEISCHGSVYIQNKIIQLLLKNGATMAGPGEFTQRAFLNGKLDLSQAEAVADLIHSQSAGAHELAMKQLRGGVSKEIDRLREELINFASLMELELDFSEEDVEFADRSKLTDLIEKILTYLEKLIDSFELGNAIKHGVPVAIVGVPNVGKSTLLNALLNEERALVSEIAGTTRDTVEDRININGIEYRFIDTAGIRTTGDQIETMGIAKTFETVDEAQIILHLIDANEASLEATKTFVDQFSKDPKTAGKKLILVINKTDLYEQETDALDKFFADHADKIQISAKHGHNLDRLRALLVSHVANGTESDTTVVTSQRHYDILTRCSNSLATVRSGLDEGISGDLLAMDIREALFQLGTITGAISTDDLLGNIFANFCIGK